MNKKLRTAHQYILPQHLLTKMMGTFANTRIVWLKNLIIDSFIKLYGVDMKSAVIENPHDYPTFNSFFTRHLKPKLRPISNETNAVLSPVDGTVAQVGKILGNTLMQAKQHQYQLDTLLGNASITKKFNEGTFATFYLAPHNYHRVHMPITGELTEMIYVPGKLFSVNAASIENIPQLYTRNERLITFFNTEAGPLAVVFVAAMIVGGIQTRWMNHPIRSNKIEHIPVPKNLKIAAGEELGLFSMGSTVILLFTKDKCKWSPNLTANQTVKYGEVVGKFPSTKNMIK